MTIPIRIIIFGAKHGKTARFTPQLAVPPSRSGVGVDDVAVNITCTFAVGQPDLNHDNPKVRQEVIDIYKYAGYGVDGFGGRYYL